MNVLAVSGPSAGGIRRHICQLRRGLERYNIKLELVEARGSSPFQAVRLAQQLRQSDVSLVHCHGFQAAWTGRLAASLTGHPAVVTLHNTLQAKGATARCAVIAERLLKDRTAAWIAVSGYLADYALTTLRIPGHRLEVIGNGIMVPRCLPPRTPRPVVGTVARLIPAKGVDIFLQALAVVKKQLPGATGLVVGDGPQRQQLEQLALQLQLDVCFCGHQACVNRWLDKMGVFVLASRSEGLGISILEAMARGVPVVAAATGGIPEIVVNKATGLLAAPDNPQQLAAAIIQLLTDQDLAESLRRRALRLLQAKYQEERMLAATAALYRRVAHG